MSRSRTLHLMASRRALASRSISARPSVWMNSASWVTGMRSPLGALTVSALSVASGSSPRGRRTARSKRRSPSNTWVATRPLVAASIPSWTSWMLMP